MLIPFLNLLINMTLRETHSPRAAPGLENHQSCGAQHVASPFPSSFFLRREQGIFLVYNYCKGV